VPIMIQMIRVEDDLISHYNFWFLKPCILVVILISVFVHPIFGENLEMTNSNFKIRFDAIKGGITSLKRVNDVYDTDYIMTSDTEYLDFEKEFRPLGEVIVRHRKNNHEWIVLNTSTFMKNRNIKSGGNEISAIYNSQFDQPEDLQDFQLIEKFKFEDGALIWMLEFKNLSDQTMEIGDIELPLLFNTAYMRDQQITYTKRLIKHAFISGHGSYLYWMRANGIGPYLVMTPMEGTQLEYYKIGYGVGGRWEGPYSVFIHSAVSGSEETRGTWRQAHTSITLTPQGSSGDQITYGFKFSWATDYEAVRDVLYNEGLFDIRAVPGMVVPNDLSAMFSLRGKSPIQAITAEHPERTVIEEIPVKLRRKKIQNPKSKIKNFGSRKMNTSIYRVRFSRLGENKLTVHYGNSSHLLLEFFVTEPLETVIKKRSAFIIEKQQHRDPAKWYNGMFCIWNMKNSTLLSPENTAGLYDYMVGGGDDNHKAIYVSEKNVCFPDPDEIAAIEYNLKHFVWGGLQRTDQEDPHPYGIYGSPNWHVTRYNKIGLNSGGNGQERMWRTFDYTHLIMTYYNMYRISKEYPDMTTYLDADGYLERAFGTTKAFFEVPYNIKMGKPWDFRGWCDWAYKQGNFHEKYIVDLIEALDKEGWIEKAVWVKNEWDKKVKYFLYDHPYPFGSEMFFGATAFESTHAIAKYAIENNLKPDEKLWYDKNLEKWYSHQEIKQEDAAIFMDKQIAANIACRGYVMPSYYLLGSAIGCDGNTRYCLQYMSQMSGWAILDYGLYYTEKPAAYIQLGYASMLSSWALLNSGTDSSDYGYWFPGRENDGAVGWAFKAEKFGPTWGIGEIGRGIWHFDGEIDNGLAGAVNAAATVVVDDPIFGLFAYGGELKFQNGTIRVTPKDGIRQRFHMLNVSPGFHMALNRDGFAADNPIIISESLNQIQFKLENRTANAHETALYFSGLPTGEYQILINGEDQSSIDVNSQNQIEVILNLRSESDHSISIEKK